MGSCLSCDEQRERNARKDKRKEAKEALATEARSDQRLALVTGRICTNGANGSACLFTQQGRKGVNQDAMIVWESFCSRKDSTFCGVFDGHGPYGHLVARRVRDSLPSKLIAFNQEVVEDWKKRLEEEEEVDSSEADVEGSDMFKIWKETHLKSYRLMDKDLRAHPTIDCFCSGTTAVTIVKQGDEIVIGNVGDSRAIMGTRAEDNSIKAIQLTVDLKPNLPEEAERIRQCRGRVFALQDEPEVARVWLPHDNSPGLAMARAFGDFCLKDFGVIAVPEISYHRITDRDEFLVLATDGVWDVLSNEEVVKIVASAPTRTTSARALVESAVRAWRLKYPTSKMDDCAVVCLYLHDVPAVQGGSSKVLHHHHEQGEARSEVASQERQENDDRDETRRNKELMQAQHDGMTEIEQEIVEQVDGTHAAAATATAGPKLKPSKSENGRNRSLKECLATDSDEDWSALEGVTRVNSLLTLPRFVAVNKNTTKKQH